MLKFVIGTAGTGKTTYLTEEIRRYMQAGEKTILMVPEQFSFDSERRIYRELGPESSLFVEVLNFTRICDSIFRKYGGLAGIPVSATAKYLLMSVVVSELQEKLETYKKSAKNIAFLDTLIATCGEFKTAGITPAALEDFVAQAPEDKLKAKLKDLSLIYTAYQTLLEKGYSDPEDSIIRATEILENNNYFEDFHVVVDGFTTFNSAEFEFIRYMVYQAKSVTFAFTTDSVVDTQKGTGVFSIVKDTIQRIKRGAEDTCTTEDETVVLTEGKRYFSPELELLSQQFLQPKPELFGAKAENVIITMAATPYDEIKLVATEIARLVREENIRYKDIAVIPRDPDSYSQLVRLIFSRYEIPFFDDRKLDVESTPLMYGVLAALNAVDSNFTGEEVLFFAKSPILGLNSYAVAQLENYVYSWQIRGSLWQSDFVNNPRGFEENFTEGDIKTLAAINETREKVIAPLIGLKERLKEASGTEFAIGIYKFLEEINCGDNLLSYGARLPETERETFLDINAQLWDNLMDTLDIFGDVIGATKMPGGRLLELFRLAVSSADIGIIPQTLDQVLVGGADRIRPSNIKVAFAIGVNEGVFPATVGTNGVFSDSERKQLTDLGLEIGGGNFHRALLERFYGYFAFTLPSKRLYVSYHIADLQGGKALPSIFVTQLEQVIPNHSVLAPEESDYIQNRSSGIGMLAETFSQDTTIRATLDKLFRADSPELVAGMETAAWKPAHILLNRQIPPQLFGRDMHLSPSKVERFHRCPFSYFMQDGLKIKKRRKVEFSPLESGTLIHYVLQVMLQKYGGKGLRQRTRQELETEVSQIISDYLKTRVEDEKHLSTRMKFLFKRLCATLARLLEQLGREFDQSLYTPVAFELPIKEDSEVKPVKLTAEDGSVITVEGYVDRVDIMEQNGNKYVRVVDYKSGRKDFKLQDVLYGLNLQMLVYLFTISAGGTGELADCLPGGILYMPIRESYSSVERSTTDEEAERLLQKQWNMSGLLLNDEESLKGMEEELAGVFIPAKLKKDGSLDARSSVAGLHEMGVLAKEVENQIIKIADALSKGEIQAYPVNDTDYETCSYCDYRSVCGYEDGDPVITIDKMTNKEVFDYLEKREEQIGE